MDRQDAKPRRPSLLAGAQTSVAAQPAPARILADMEGRESAPQGTAATTRKRWLPVASLLVVVAAAGWWWQSPPVVDTVAGTTPGSLSAVDGDAPAPGDSRMPGAATIIEEAVPASIASAPGDVQREGTVGAGIPDLAINPMAALSQSDVASRIAKADGTINPFLAKPAAVTAAKPAASRPPSRNRERAKAPGEPDLFAILMGNIKPDDDQGSGLDVFLQTMDADSPGVASAERNRNGRPQRTRSQQIQQNLRECPAANTAKGLKCRQEICAVYAGRDPACPAAG